METSNAPKIYRQELLSECCGWPPVDEVDDYLTGRCSGCKEGAMFYVRKGG